VTFRRRDMPAPHPITASRKRATIRSFALLVCALVLGATVVAGGPAPVKAGDSLTDLRLPSSTIPGCLNHWGLFGTGSGIAEPTCEGKAALAEWNEHAAAINAASETLARAANSPDKTAPLAIIDALDICAAATDVMARLYRPAPGAPYDDAAVVAWMRNWLAQSKLPAPVTVGDGFRAANAARSRSWRAQDWSAVETRQYRAPRCPI
jgi:hypothetical protein